MKIITFLILTLFTLNSFACPCPDLFKVPEDQPKVESKQSRYKEFTLAKNKKMFIENEINNNLEVATILGQNNCEISKFKKLRENSAVLFLQASCKGVSDNIHLVLPKIDVIETKMNTCELAKKKFGSYVVCQGKI